MLSSIIIIIPPGLAFSRLMSIYLHKAASVVYNQLLVGVPGHQMAVIGHSFHWEGQGRIEG